MSATSLAARLNRLLFAACLPALAACAGAPARNDTLDAGSLLRDSLPVAAAALGAGQLDVARRLYLFLAERFPSAPEPALGLAYIAWYSGDLAAAGEHFSKAAGLAGERPELAAEARLGAGRVALARGDHGRARQIFEDACGPSRDTPAAPWILNGLAVAASLDGDYEAAEAHYEQALRISPENPRIVANRVRTLLGAGRVAEAARIHAARPGSFWEDEDGVALARLIEEARRKMALARAPATGGGVPTSRGSAPLPRRPSRPDTREVADSRERRPPPPNLALRLSDFSLSPPGPGPAAGAPLAPPDPSELVLRIADWPGPITPPTLNGQFRHAPYWPPDDPAAPSPRARPPEPSASMPAEEPSPAEEPPPAGIDETATAVPEPPPPSP